jgi:isopentenyl-diphosphate Delta-isomerase
LPAASPLGSTHGSFREEAFPPRDGRSARPPIATAGAERVVLVDEHDEPLGTAEKLAAHLDGGRLHRAFSIFLFDRSGRVLLQQRAGSKYHFASLWTNACCSHPRPGEDVEAAARRRLFEELGVEVELVRLFSFLYSAEDPISGLVERELDHVFAGRIEGDLRPCSEEVSAVAFEDFDAVERSCARRPERFTPWFPLALRELRARGFVEAWTAPI